MSKKIIAFFMASMFLIIQSCTYDNMDDPYPDNDACDTTSISYIKDLAPIFNKSCNSCHSGSSAPAGIKTDNYNDVKTYLNAIIGAVEHRQGFRPMPQGSSKLSECNINKINRWNNLGKPDN